MKIVIDEKIPFLKDMLQNLGYDVRILQLDDPNVKDPDEYVVKNGSGRFNLCTDKAISLVEFKVKMLKQMKIKM